MTKRIVLLLAALGLLATGQIITSYPRMRLRYAWSDTVRVDSAGRAYYWASDVDDSLIPSRNWCRNNAGVQAESVFTWSDADDTLGFLYCKNQKGYGYWLFFAPDTAGADALPAITSAGSGVFYSAKKCAFAGGYNRVGLWSQDSIGKHSFKFGVNNYAKDTSFIAGLGNLALGYVNTCFGGECTTQGNWSANVGGRLNGVAGAYAVNIGGLENYCHGLQAFTAGGSSDSATGDGAVALGGAGNHASGDNALATGYQCKAGGDYAIAAGRYTNVSGTGSFGYNVTTGASFSSVTADSSALFCLGGGNVTLESTKVFAVTGARTSFGSVTPSPTCQLHVQGIIDVTGDIRRKAEVNGADNVYCRELEIEDSGSVSEIVGPVGGDVGGSVTLFTVPDSCELVRCKVLVTTYDAQGEEANTSIAIGTTANADATIAGDEENLVIESNYFGASAPPCRTATGDQGALIYNAGDHLYPWQASGSTVYLNWAAQGSGMGGDVTFSVVAVISLIIQPMRTGSM